MHLTTSDMLLEVKTANKSKGDDYRMITRLLDPATQRSRDSRILRVRALLDPGSEASFATSALVQRLGIPLQEANVIVHAIGGHQAGTSQRQATISIQQRGGRCDIHVNGLILRHLGVKTPQMPVRSQAWINESSLDLADPHYMIPSSVEILLGADVYGSLMLDGVQHGPLGVTVAQRTTLGWVVTGPANPLKNRQPSPPKLSALSTIQKNNQLRDSLSKFWEQEELSRSAVVSPDDFDCEKLYCEGQRRDDVGRYIVRLPLRLSPTNKLEGSLVIAQRLYRALDNRLRRDSKLRESYNQFMSEYERLGHMRPLLPSQQNSKGESAYYIPHHGIWKESEGRSKLRVVFNASQPTTSGTTLNQLLHVGPKLQNDLPTILMRWRFHKIAFSADIQMMYRQIRIDERDVDLQRILWKRPGDTKETHYQLMTVTYGLACAPYLAIRTLQQLAADEGDKYPNAARVLRQDTYVDDILTGAEDEDSAKLLSNELIALTEAGRFHLKKWVANRQSITESVTENDRLRPYWKDFRDDGPTKALGISWDPVLDEFRFKPPQFQVDSTPTKRQILSAIARLFDPIGWLSPITIVAKILLQDIWREGLDWDDLVPRHLNVRWTKFWSSLTAVTDLTIPRWLGFNKSCKLEIHGFADASKLAYAAVIYLRMCRPDGTEVSRMITAKTRVAPTKTITIPRLELCAAVLVTKLLHQVITELDFRGIPIHAWSDSKTVLAWLRSDSSRWSVFVANRVSEVQQTLPEARWNFVSTLDNPADVASRGTDPRTLQGHRLWWQGPAWLVKPQSNWPTDVPRDTANDEELPLPELKGVSCQQIRVTRDTFHRFSGLTRLLRVIARCLRFRLCLIELLERRDRIKAPLSSKELDHAFLGCVAWSQSVGFQQELATLSEGRSLTRKHPMSRLRPFLDRTGILRVGGRLEYASLPYDQRHPVILPSRFHLSTLVIDWAHKTALHGGSQLTHANVLRKAWILRGTSRVKSYVRNCITCNRTRPRRSEQQMGNLPAERVTASSRPFSRVGLDYAGPLSVKTTKGRGRRSVKGYVAFFVCLSTKAVHLELVGDLTTNSFLAALKQFAGRRGPPREIWSDNATTLHGVNTALHAMLREAEIDWEQIADSLANEGIQWSFIPPGAPHFGGLWEAAVKSAKSHLKRVIGTQMFSYEELYTFLVQIEMCMNSRHLTAITGEVDDLNVLTPGHFLVGTTLNRIPEPTYPERTLNHETRWRLIQAMRDHFWRRWAREYLHTLQQRYKWTHPRENHQVNDIVVVMDPSLLEQGRWPLGRVITVHPGQDGLVRVVTVKTRTGTYVRPIVKICKLPVVHEPPTPINENDH